MKLLRFMKNNVVMTGVILMYAFLFILRFDIGIAAVKNSGYYIKEMLMIMPVVFVLTALLDTWVPKETIIKYLGKDSKAKGTFFAFLLGSISAGPIYAAFPICTLLLRKGATVRNIVIILSSWAVIKIPMLINEVAFLGMKFMAIRWVLTIIVIIIFSALTDIIVKKEHMPLSEKSGGYKFTINNKACIGCSLCEKKYGHIFKVKERKAFVIYDGVEKLDNESMEKILEVCPMKAIRCE